MTAERTSKGVKQLLIDQVLMRGLLVKIDENRELEDIQDKHLKHTQILKQTETIRELTLDEKANLTPKDQGFYPYMYKFYVTLGIRSLYQEDAGQDLPDDSIVPMLEIKTDYVVQYHSKCSLTEDECLEFANTHVYFHAWPYFREAVQSSCARLGIIGIPIPPYRV